jgi:alpha-galactosidase
MRTHQFLFVLIVSFLLSPFANAQKFSNLAPTPPMGWNSWNKFACNVNEKLIRETADAMVSSGLKDAGYEYINIDDCWHGERDSLGFITSDKVNFPSGIKSLADYIHSKGLKFGIYSCAGFRTCAGRPSSRGYEFQDAFMYANWGVDYLKLDWCNSQKLNAEGAYMTMSEAIRKAGRPMILSICEWGENKPWTWGKDLAQLWRTTGDIEDCFNCINKHGGAYTTSGVLQILDLQDGLRQYAGPNHWNDPDMLEVGNGMPLNEQRAHFTMWCMLAAPLIAGNDLRNMTAETLNILTNKELLAIDQDSLGIQGFKYQSTDSVETWLKPLSNGEWAYCILNRSLQPKVVTIDWKTLNITDTLSGKKIDTTGKIVYKYQDVWVSKNAGNTNKPIKITVPSRDVFCIKIKKVK